MINRRQRLEFALTLLPYDPETVQLSEAQKRVVDIIARLRTDDSLTEEESDGDGKMQPHEEDAEAFADRAMRQIELTDNGGKLSTLETLTRAAERLLKSQEEEEEDLVPDPDYDEFVRDVETTQLMRSTIQAVNEARMKLMKQWERSKRKALDLLTIEIEKVQEMDQEQEEEQEQEQDQEQDQEKQPSSRFEMFREGTEEHNTSTPKTNDEDLGIDDDDDEEYVPDNEESSSAAKKRKRATKKPVTSTPNAKRPCPGFEFDQDQKSTMVMIGPNGTKILRSSLSAINWDMTGPSITRKLLCEIFDRDTLAHHTLSGKPSPAFKDCARPSKQQLDPLKVADLVYLMTNSLDMTPREVRTAITTKCADENKMLRSKMQRQRKAK